MQCQLIFVVCMPFSHWKVKKNIKGKKQLALQEKAAEDEGRRQIIRGLEELLGTERGDKTSGK